MGTNSVLSPIPPEDSFLCVFLDSLYRSGLLTSIESHKNDKICSSEKVSPTVPKEKRRSWCILYTTLKLPGWDSDNLHHRGPPWACIHRSEDISLLLTWGTGLNPLDHVMWFLKWHLFANFLPVFVCVWAPGMPCTNMEVGEQLAGISFHHVGSQGSNSGH